MNSSDVVVGAKFGRWTVLETNVKNPDSKAKNPPRMAKCQCECGTIRYKEYRDLYSGRSLSCGCLRNEQTAQRNKEKSSVRVGNIYGYLEVVEDLGYRQQSRGKNESWYRCVCHHCGNDAYEVNGNNLQSGACTSCGCVNSHGEAYITELLINNHIEFARQYSFADLLSPKNARMFFDFAIFSNSQLLFLVEFDGKQHYTGPEGNWTEGKDLQTIQEYDKIKNEYCKKHNIKLKRIPYFDFNKITIESLLDDTFTI